MEVLSAIIKDDIPVISIQGRVCHHKIKILYALCKQFNLENYLEIGVHNGSSMSYVLQCNYIKQCVGIDPFEKLQTSDPTMIHYQQNDHITLNKSLQNIQNNNKHGADIQLVQEYSCNVNPDKFGNNVDLLFIDGDHNYNAVLKDYHMFKRCVRPGGFIVFDDLHQEGPGRVFNEVQRHSDVKLFGIYDKTEGILVKM